MKFEPSDFIKVSKELIDKDCNQAHFRTIVSRAYYGAFGHIRQKIEFYNDSSSVHRELISRLIHSKIINEKRIGKKLEVLFKRRKEADYNYTENFSINTCDFAIREADEIIRLAESLM